MVNIPTGSFMQFKGKFCSNNTYFYVKDRKEQKPNKPEKYLISIEQGNFNYISSLYGVEKTDTTEVFKFDYFGEFYLLHYEESLVEISKIEI